jgi:xylulokinase
MWLAYDIGTTETKATLINDAGEVVAAAYRKYPTHTQEGGIVEQDVHDWWTAIVETTRELAPGEIEGIAVTGQMQDVVLLDESGEPTYPVILYSDTRAREEAAEYTAWVDTTTLRAQTGNKQGEGADGLPAKLTWLAKHAPAALDDARYLLLGAGDYAVFRLTGEAVTDSTTASTTGLMAMGRSRLLGARLLPELVRPHVGKMARIIPGGKQAGSVTPKAAQALGLPFGTPVYIGPGDAGATAFGSGCSVPGKVYLYLGTSGWVAFSSPTYAPFSGGAITIAHPRDGLHIQIAPLLTAGGNLERALKIFNAPDYETLLAKASPDPVNVIYLPYLNGERSPFVDPLARAAFIGIDNTTTDGVLIRALMTGVAYGYRHALDDLMRHSLDVLVMTGGGTRSRLWTQIFADVLGVPVQIAADAGNVGVRGAVAAARRQAFDAPIEETVKPNPAHRAHYDRQYAAYRRVYPALKGVFAALAAE